LIFKKNLYRRIGAISYLYRISYPGLKKELNKTAEKLTNPKHDSKKKKN